MKAKSSDVLEALSWPEDLYTLIGKAYVSFGVVYSMLVKRISDRSDDSGAVQKKHIKGVVGKSLKDVNSVLLDIDSYEANRIQLKYLIDENGDIQFDIGQRGLRKVPSILGMQFKDLIDDRTKIAHSLVANTEGGMQLIYNLRNGEKGVITPEFLNNFIEDCNRFSQQILIYDQMKSEGSASK